MREDDDARNPGPNAKSLAGSRAEWSGDFKSDENASNANSNVSRIRTMEFGIRATATPVNDDIWPDRSPYE